MFYNFIWKLIFLRMKKLKINQKQISASGIMDFGGWGFATLSNVLVNSAVGLTTNALNISNSLKHNTTNIEQNIYTSPLITRYNFF